MFNVECFTLSFCLVININPWGHCEAPLRSWLCMWALEGPSGVSVFLPAIYVSCSPLHFGLTYHIIYKPALRSFNTVLTCFQIFVVSPISCIWLISTSFQENSLLSLSDVVGISAGDAFPSQTGHVFLMWCWLGHVYGRSANISFPLFSSYMLFGNRILWSVLDDTILQKT